MHIRTGPGLPICDQSGNGEGIRRLKDANRKLADRAEKLREQDARLASLERAYHGRMAASRDGSGRDTRRRSGNGDTAWRPECRAPRADGSGRMRDRRVGQDARRTRSPPLENQVRDEQLQTHACDNGHLAPHADNCILIRGHLKNICDGRTNSQMGKKLDSPSEQFAKTDV